jgi:hypothetical protein
MMIFPGSCCWSLAYTKDQNKNAPAFNFALNNFVMRRCLISDSLDKIIFVGIEFELQFEGLDKPHFIQTKIYVTANMQIAKKLSVLYVMIARMIHTFK